MKAVITSAAALRDDLAAYIKDLNDQLGQFKYELTVKENRIKRLQKQMRRDVTVTPATEVITNSSGINERFQLIVGTDVQAVVFDEKFLEPRKYCVVYVLKPHHTLVTLRFSLQVQKFRPDVVN